jgi:hypothetical protein
LLQSHYQTKHYDGDSFSKLLQRSEKQSHYFFYSFLAFVS